MPSWRNGRRAGLKHLWETVPVRVRRWVRINKKGLKLCFDPFFCFQPDIKLCLNGGMETKKKICRILLFHFQDDTKWSAALAAIRRYKKFFSLEKQKKQSPDSVIGFCNTKVNK